MGKRKKNIASIIGAGIIVVALFFAFISWPKPSSISMKTGNSVQIEPTHIIPGVPISPTAAPVPVGVVVPNEGDIVASSNVAIPTVETSAHVTGTASYRQFSIMLNGGRVSPSTVIVRWSDIVDLEITAIDKNYTFTQPDYGFNVPINKGKTKKVQFQALNPGKFTFYCSTCGGPKNGPVGYVIIAPN